MKSTTLWVVLDVHKESISVAVFEDTRLLGRPAVTLPNDPTQIRKLFSRLKKEGGVRACYEAGGCGYEVYRQPRGSPKSGQRRSSERRPTVAEVARR